MTTPTLQSAQRNIAGTGTGAPPLAEKDIWMDMLADAKSAVKCLAGSAIEAATPNVRHYFAKELQTALDHQDRIFRFAEQKGWYPAYDPPERQAQHSIQEAIAARD